jgi:hypothetical protein
MEQLAVSLDEAVVALASEHAILSQGVGVCRLRLQWHTTIKIWTSGEKTYLSLEETWRLYVATLFMLAPICLLAPQVIGQAVPWYFLPALAGLPGLILVRYRSRCRRELVEKIAQRCKVDQIEPATEEDRVDAVRPSDAEPRGIWATFKARYRAEYQRIMAERERNPGVLDRFIQRMDAAKKQRQSAPRTTFWQRYRQTSRQYGVWLYGADADMWSKMAATLTAIIFAVISAFAVVVASPLFAMSLSQGNANAVMGLFFLVLLVYLPSLRLLARTFALLGGTTRRSAALAIIALCFIVSPTIIYQRGYYDAMIAGWHESHNNDEAAYDRLQRALSKNPDAFLVQTDVACYFARKGDITQALDCLEKASALWYWPIAVKWLDADSDYAQVRKDPRYTRLVAPAP